MNVIFGFLFLFTISNLIENLNFGFHYIIFSGKKGGIGKEKKIYFLMISFRFS